MSKRYYPYKIYTLLNDLPKEARLIWAYDQSEGNVYRSVTAETDLADLVDHLFAAMQAEAGFALFLGWVEEAFPHLYGAQAPYFFETDDEETPSQGPYRGLAAFREKDEAYFFGRETFIDPLVTMIQRQALVAVVGPSGSGKSSVVFAGAVPQLLKAGGWLVADFRPGDDPFLALAGALVPLYETDLSKTALLGAKRDLAKSLQASRYPLTDVFELIQEAQGRNYRLLLIADQFEELYTLTQDDTLRRHFLDTLLQISPPENKAGLLQGSLLAEAESWLDRREGELGPAERNFIQASLKRHKRGQAGRGGCWFVTTLVALVLLFLGRAWWSSQCLAVGQAVGFGVHCQQINMLGIDLFRANLSEADLPGADLRGANLRGVDLSWANLREADLIGANLSGTGLYGANLNEADLHGADLRGADLRGTGLYGADLHEVKIDGTTQIDDKWRLVWEIVNQSEIKRNLSEANLIWADLRGANLREANLRGADLSGTNLSGADLRGADLRRADLRGAGLIGADLHEVEIDRTTQINDKWRLVWEIVNQSEIKRNLSEADLSGANLSEANLSRVDLNGANLSGANLSGANLSGADLSGAEYNSNPFIQFGIRLEPTKWPDNFDPEEAGAIDLSKQNEENSEGN